jgi:mono/diheme cytochrome c family protein
MGAGPAHRRDVKRTEGDSITPDGFDFGPRARFNGRMPTSPRLSRTLALPLLLAGALVFADRACAAGDPEQGHALAKTWCSGCHAVEPGGVQRDAPAPPFPSIAAQHPEQLRAFLTSPHPPMPNFNLSRSQIDDLVAYIQSLGARP